jgi:type I restriction enzyme, S subunit
MHDSWSSTTLGELVTRGILEVSDGYRTRQDQLAESGIPILRVADVLDGSLAPSFKDHVAFEYRPRMGPKTSRTDDVLITTKGTVGRIAQIPSGFPEHVYSPQVCFLRSLNANALVPGWLYGWARSPEFASRVGAYKDQTDMAPYLNLRDLRQFRITLPPREEQWRIAAALGAFDNLIDINRQLAGQLDSRLVASWLALAQRCHTERALGELVDLRKGISYRGVFLAKHGLPLINLANFALDGSFKESGTKHYLGPVKDRQLLSKGRL